MQVEISDQMYRQIENVLGSGAASVPAFVEGAVREVLSDPDARYAVLAATLIEEARQRGPYEPSLDTDTQAARQRFFDTIDRLREQVSHIPPDELQRMIDEAVDEIEQQYRSGGPATTLSPRCSRDWAIHPAAT